MSDNDFEREKLCYEQNFEQARALNIQMNRVPAFSVTLTGGLWFGAGLTDNVDPAIRFALLIFAGLSNVALGFVCLRIRDVMESYLEKVKAFHENSFASGRLKRPKLGRFGDYSMISIYCILMLIAAIMSFVGAFGFYWPSSFGFSVWWGVTGLVVVLMAVAYLLRSEKRTK